MQSDIGFVKKLFLCFEREKVSYCVLRNSGEIISGDAHDIDMAIDFKCFSLVRKIINDIAGTEWKIHYISEKDNGNLVAIHLYKIDQDTPVLIHFDFFQSFGWNGYGGCELFQPDVPKGRRQQSKRISKEVVGDQETELSDT